MPTDTASGLPSGRAQHSPYTFTLRADAPSDTNVRLLNSFTANEVLTSCVFRYYHVDVSGKPALYLTVTLTNAQLLSHSFQHKNSADTVTWSLYYKKITWQGTSFTTTTTWSAAA